jgi:uncharacterized protein with PIN domain
VFVVGKRQYKADDTLDKWMTEMKIDEKANGAKEKAAFRKYKKAKGTENKLDDFDCCVYDVPIAEWEPD